MKLTYKECLARSCQVIGIAVGVIAYSWLTVFVFSKNNVAGVFLIAIIVPFFIAGMIYVDMGDI